MELVLVVLLVISIVFIFTLKGQTNKLQTQIDDLKKAEADLPASETAASETAAGAPACQDTVSASDGEVWELANTIHLYASLAEEEAASASVKEKQQEIINLSSAIMAKLNRPT